MGWAPSSGHRVIPGRGALDERSLKTRESGRANEHVPTIPPPV
jgi:hypothetical protein